MALAGLKAMVAGAVRDRMALLAVMALIGVFLASAWVLLVVALVIYLTTFLGTVGALLAVAGGLVVLSGLMLWMTRSRNRRSAELRVATRALWTATAANAASSLLRRESKPTSAEPDSEPGHQSGGSLRSAFLVAAGLALMLLAYLYPGGKGDDTGDPDGPPAPGPDGVA